MSVLWMYSNEKSRCKAYGLWKSARKTENEVITSSEYKWQVGK